MEVTNIEEETMLLFSQEIPKTTFTMLSLRLGRHFIVVKGNSNNILFQYQVSMMTSRKTVS